MTTDLTNDPEVDEDDFEWDVFVPDPDEAELAAEAAALDDESELNLDDSDFDWEAALQEDSELDGAEGQARAGAAFDRIVDTVRRNYEDPEAETELQDSADLDPDLEPEPSRSRRCRLSGSPRPSCRRNVAQNPKPRRRSSPKRAQPEELEIEEEHEAEVKLEPEAELEPEVELEPECERPSRVDRYRVSVIEPDGAPEPDEDALETELELEVDAELEAEAGLGPGAARAPEGQVLESERSPCARAGGDAGARADHHPGARAGCWRWCPRSHGKTPTSSRRPAVPHASRRKNADRKGRSRVFTLTAVLACLLVVLVAGAAIVHALHHSTTPAAAPPTHHAAAPSPSPGTSRLQTATDATDSATTAAQVALTSLSNFPTPTNVATIINPYISSLQLYETFLSGSDAPAPARAAVAHAETQVRQDLKFLDTIDGLPPIQLGSYLVQFDTDATQLQTTLSALEQDLRSPAS